MSNIVYPKNPNRSLSNAKLEPMLLPIQGLPDHLSGVFSAEIEHQLMRIVNESVQRMSRNKSFFSETEIEDRAKEAAKREMDNILVPDPMVEKEYGTISFGTKKNILFLEHPNYPDLLKALIQLLPLVELGRTNKLTTEENLQQEQEILRIAKKQTDIHVLDEKVVEGAIARNPLISEEQTRAVLVGTRTSSIVSAIEGTAGAGKSFTMFALKMAYEDSGYQVRGTALSWNAAKVLEASAKIGGCEAIEGMVQAIEKCREIGTPYFDRPTVLIVDEAGMVGVKHIYKLFREAEESRFPVKIILTGDSKQVMPVDAGNVLEMLIETKACPSSRINTIRRQKQESHRTAVYRLSERKAGQALYVYMHQEALRWAEDKETMMNMVVQDYLSYRIKYPGKSSLVLALTNDEVTELNKRIRTALRKMGQIKGKEIKVKVTDGKMIWEAPFSVGDQVVIRNNDRNMIVYEIDPEASVVDDKEWKISRVGLFNRNAGRIVGMRRANSPAGSWDLIVDLGGETPGRVIVNTAKFLHPEKRAFPVVPNFATTIYASQGQTVQKVFLLDSKGMDFRLSYVGASRHTESLTIYLNETDLNARIDARKRKEKSISAAVKEKERKESGNWNKKEEEEPILTKRASKMEMLQEVSNTWGRFTSNRTAILFEYLHRTGQLYKKDPKDLFYIENPYGKGADWKSVIDFIPENNVNIQKVDIAQLLFLDDPKIEEAELVVPSQVDENRKTIDSTVPLRTRQKYFGGLTGEEPQESPRKETKKQGLGLFEKLLQGASSIIKGYDPFVDESTKKHEEWLENERKIAERSGMNPAIRDNLPTKPFELPKAFSTKEEYDAHCDALVKAGEKDPRLNHIKDFADFVEEDQIAGFFDKLSEATAKVVQKVFGKVEVPMLPIEQPCGVIHFENKEFEVGPNKKETKPYPVKISWEGVPCIRNPDGTPVKSPKDNTMVRLFQHLWDVGKDMEPRILAKNFEEAPPHQEIMARYKMDGTCVVGEGYPPLLVNQNYKVNTTPVVIFAGVVEWLAQREQWANEYKKNPEKIPHVLWAAKDIDWQQIALFLKTQDVVVYVEEKDPKQRLWAEALAKTLYEKYEIKARLWPCLENYKTPWGEKYTKEMLELHKPEPPSIREEVKQEEENKHTGRRKVYEGNEISQDVSEVIKIKQHPELHTEITSEDLEEWEKDLVIAGVNDEIEEEDVHHISDEEDFELNKSILEEWQHEVYQQLEEELIEYDSAAQKIRDELGIPDDDIPDSPFEEEEMIVKDNKTEDVIVIDSKNVDSIFDFDEETLSIENNNNSITKEEENKNQRKLKF